MKKETFLSSPPLQWIHLVALARLPIHFQFTSSVNGGRKTETWPQQRETIGRN